MNIFYLDECPKKAAQLQYNKHVVKMILESAQMLCTAHHVYGNPDDMPYKQAHLNHPSTVWARKNASNYKWLFDHFCALSAEYKKRYNRTHLSYTKCFDPLSWIPAKLEGTFNGITKMPQCMPDEYKDKCSVQAYWNYYIGEKHIVANKKTEKIYDRRIN